MVSFFSEQGLNIGDFGFLAWHRNRVSSADLDHKTGGRLQVIAESRARGLLLALWLQG
jgi:hypothetical protein